MKTKEAELSEPDSSSTRHSPFNSSPHSPAQSSPQSAVSTSPFKLHKKKKLCSNQCQETQTTAVLISVEDGINDPYQYRSPSTSSQLPLHLSPPTLPAQVSKLTARAVSVAASNQLLSPCYHLNQEINQVNQFMILFIVPGVTVGLSISDMTDWDIYRNTTTCTVIPLPDVSSHYQNGP
jgi:hypothetical protein